MKGKVARKEVKKEKEVKANKATSEYQREKKSKNESAINAPQK